MYKKLFVLFVVLILSIFVTYLFIYNKEIINQEKESQIISEQNEQIIEDEENTETKENNVEEIIGTLVIDKINLNGKIKQGSSTEILKDYIGHIEETSIYDGNVGLAAHNRGNYYSYFARINELEVDDEIKYITKYGERKYQVINKKEILETDWSLLESSKENKLTLITCIPNKINLRLCVQAVEKSL